MDPDTGPAEGQGRSRDHAVVPLDLGVVKQEGWGDSGAAFDLDTGQGHDQVRKVGRGTTGTQLGGEFNFFDTRCVLPRCAMLTSYIFIEKQPVSLPFNIKIPFRDLNTSQYGKKSHFQGFSK